MILLAAILCLPAQGSSTISQALSKAGMSQVMTNPCPTFSPVLYLDPAGDAVIRRTGTNPNAPVDEFLHNRPDIIAYQIGNWRPDAPSVDLFTGCWDSAGIYFRFDIAFAGQVNPPGLWALASPQFDPYRFGPHPLFGYISLDVDRNTNSGGENLTPQFRFLANAARFGGLPFAPRFLNRFAKGGGDIDGIFDTPPFIERSGEDFHIALFGDLFDPGCMSIFEEVGNGDCTFDPLEIWHITAPILHRAHGYEPFSFAGGDGEYAPLVTLRFESGFAGLNLTLVSLVYPLTNAGSAQMIGPAVPVQPMDGDDTNQNSLQEGLQDLVDSVLAIPLGDVLRQTPSFALIQPWELESPANHLNAANWEITALVSMSYVNQDPLGDVFVWTDAAPDPKRGDFNGNGIVEIQDVVEFNTFLMTNDGVVGVDADGVPGSVSLFDFGPNFSVYDLNYDGIIDAFDRQSIVIRGDMDGDFDIDILDAQLLSQALVRPGLIPGAVVRGDVNEDGLFDGRDISAFLGKLLALP